MKRNSENLFRVHMDNEPHMLRGQCRQDVPTSATLFFANWRTAAIFNSEPPGGKILKWRLRESLDQKLSNFLLQNEVLIITTCVINLFQCSGTLCKPWIYLHESMIFNNFTYQVCHYCWIISHVIMKSLNASGCYMAYLIHLTLNKSCDINKKVPDLSNKDRT